MGQMEHPKGCHLFQGKKYEKAGGAVGMACPWAFYLWSYFFVLAGWLALAYVIGGVTPKQWIGGEWMEWDSAWYRTISSEWYKNPTALAFPPGYPAIVVIFSAIFSVGFSSAAMTVNLAAGFLFPLFAAETCQRHFGVDRRAMFSLILSNPLAYFNFPAYSDALFSMGLWILLMICLIPKVGARLQAGAGILLLTLPLVRITGFALILPVFLRKYLFLLPIIPLCIWLGINYSVTGDAFYFLGVQEAFGMPKGGILDGFRGSWNTFWGADHFPTKEEMAGFLMNALTLALFLMLVAVGVWLVWRGDYFLAILLFGILFISHNQSFWRSGARYDIPLLPFLYAFILQLRWQRIGRKWREGGIVTLILVQLSLQFWLGWRFLTGHWAY
jgi:hypothetical protein